MSVLESYVNIEFSNYYDLHNYTINICNHKLTLNNNYSRKYSQLFCNFAVIKLFKLFFFLETKIHEYISYFFNYFYSNLNLYIHYISIESIVF